MAKSTDVHDLLTAYQKQVRKIPAKGIYASKQRQQEVQAAHTRKVMRQRRRLPPRQPMSYMTKKNWMNALLTGVKPLSSIMERGANS